jgi:TolB-like protein
LPNAAPSPEQVRDALDEVLAWQGIARSPQLAELLRYVVEKTLAGEAAGIKAYSIAVDVFGRPLGFDPQADPIVRVQARRLRTLLEQFYQSDQSHVPVQIHLPLGRYVPDFELVGPPTAPSPTDVPASAAGGLPPDAVSTDARLRGFLLRSLFALGFGLAGMILAILLGRLVAPGEPSIDNSFPTTPRLFVSSFDNLTGDAGLDSVAKDLAPDLERRMRRFDEVAIVLAPARNALVLHGALQTEDRQLTLRATLSDANGNGILWAKTFKSLPGSSLTTTLEDAASRITGELGSWRGPLHAPSRAWFAEQKAIPEAPTHYVCMLAYFNWRDTRLLANADKALACLDDLLSRTPTDGAATAAHAGLSAWRAEYLSKPADSMTDLLAPEVTEAARAIALSPTSSFAYERQAMVLARAGSVNASFGSFTKALALNPGNTDAQSLYASILWRDGQWQAATSLGERAIDSVDSPPPSYFAIRAYEAMRQKRYLDAIAAAQVMATGDEETATAIALAAAPFVGRDDLVVRYRPSVLGDSRFQEAGILPRLLRSTGSQLLIDRLREGLLKAGIPQAALDGAFNPDGTASK